MPPMIFRGAPGRERRPSMALEATELSHLPGRPGPFQARAPLDAMAIDTG